MIQNPYAGLTLVQAPTVEPITLATAKGFLNVSLGFTRDDFYIQSLISVARQHIESILRRALLTQVWQLSLQNFPGRNYNSWPESITEAPDAWNKTAYIKLPLPPLQSVISLQYIDTTGKQYTMPQGLTGGAPMNPFAAWRATNLYYSGELIASGGFVQAVTTGGTSGGTLPVFGSTTGATTTDGTVVWTCQGPVSPATPWGTGNAAVSNGYNVFTDYEPGRIWLPFSQIWPTVILLPGAPIKILFVAGYVDVPTLQTQFEGYYATIQALQMIVGYCYENRIPPAEVRKGITAGGVDFIAEQLLENYRCWE